MSSPGTDRPQWEAAEEALWGGGDCRSKQAPCARPLLQHWHGVSKVSVPLSERSGPSLEASNDHLETRGKELLSGQTALTAGPDHSRSALRDTRHLLTDATPMVGMDLPLERIQGVESALSKLHFKKS